MLEIVRIIAPWWVLLYGCLFFGIVAVESVTVEIDEFDGILKLCYR